MKTVFIYLYRNGTLIKESFMPVQAFHEFATKLYTELGGFDPEIMADDLIHEIDEELAPCIDSPVNNMRFEFLKG